MEVRSFLGALRIRVVAVFREWLPCVQQEVADHLLFHIMIWYVSCVRLSALNTMSGFGAQYIADMEHLETLTDGKCGKAADADEGCTPGPRRPPPRFGMNPRIHGRHGNGSGDCWPQRSQRSW